MLCLAVENLNLVFIDDDIENRNILKIYFRDINKNILEFENGDISIDELAAFSPDFIFLDWFMPEVNGLEFLKRLDSAGRTDLIKKCIIFSGHAQINDMGKYKELVYRLLSKPLTKSELLTSLFD